MSRHVVEAGEDATVQELRTLVTAADDGRVAVLRGAELVSVVTRVDLLRALEGEVAQPSDGAVSIAQQMRASARLHEAAEAVAALGDRATASTSSAARSGTSSWASRASTST